MFELDGVSKALSLKYTMYLTYASSIKTKQHLTLPFSLSKLYAKHKNNEKNRAEVGAERRKFDLILLYELEVKVSKKNCTQNL